MYLSMKNAALYAQCKNLSDKCQLESTFAAMQQEVSKEDHSKEIFGSLYKIIWYL